MLIFAGSLTFLMLLVVYLDATRYLIPNWLVGTVIGLYIPFVLMTPAPLEWWWGLAMFGIFLIAGFVMFALRWTGGGDAKLLAACGLWVGKAAALEFVVLFALFGGVLSLLILGLRVVGPWLFGKLPGKPKIPRVLTYGEPIPYGLAIAAGMLWVLWQGLLPGLPIPSR